MRMSGGTIHWVLGLAATCFLVSLAVLVGQAARTSSSVPVFAHSGPADAATAGPPRGARSAMPQDPVTTAPAAQAGYVGEETCLGCHTDYTRGYHDSAHGRAANPRAPMALQGCERCHGPGAAHVEDPVDNPVLRFKVVDPATPSTRRRS